MNDFTKEELEHLLFAYKESNISAVKGLADKLQSMIDNYCEHDYRHMGNNNWLHCIKCKNNFFFTESKI